MCYCPAQVSEARSPGWKEMWKICGGLSIWTWEQCKQSHFIFIINASKHEVTFLVHLSKCKSSKEYTWCCVLPFLVTWKEPRSLSSFTEITCGHVRPFPICLCFYASSLSIVYEILSRRPFCGKNGLHSVPSIVHRRLTACFRRLSRVQQCSPVLEKIHCSCLINTALHDNMPIYHWAPCKPNFSYQLKFKSRKK